MNLSFQILKCRRRFARLLLLCCSVVFASAAVPQEQAGASRPNIIVIMGDDIGYSDIGAYGSEIQTPNLDKLAANGLRFRTFYNFAKCEVTRSSLLTGLYKGDERSQNVAALLGQNGYETMHCGKEHFEKWVPEHCYARNAFHQSFYFWAINEFHIPPDGTFANPFYLGHQKLDVKDIQVNRPPFYKPDVVTDYALKFIEGALQKGKPFFLYLPYHIAHYPLQATEQDIARYRGRYLVGWDVIRQRRYEKMMRSGLLSDKYKLAPPSDNINKFRGAPKNHPELREKIPLYRPWNSLSADEQTALDLEMAVYAAMIDRMDQNIGRLVQKLEQEELLENTIIMVLSDNGSCPYDSNRDFYVPPGPADSYRTLSAAWASVGNTPFRYFKQFGHEGGSNTFFIAHWPKKIRPGTLSDHPGHVLDIFPTLLEVTGTRYPEVVGQRPSIPLHGSSLVPAFAGEPGPKRDFLIAGFGDKFRMYRAGDWKIVRANGEEWELYNMKEDPTEMNNLAGAEPSRVATLQQQYQQRMESIDTISLPGGNE